MRVVLVLPALIVGLLIAPAAHASSLECDENSHLGPTPPDVYACSEDRNANPVLDCYRAGLFLPVVQEMEIRHQCNE